MPTITGCIRKAGAALQPEDKDAILERFNALTKDGTAAAEAARQAIDEQIAAVRAMLEPSLAPGASENQAPKERAEAMAAKGQPVHQDPGEAPEVATKAVVTEAVRTAAGNRDRKPSEMRAELLRMVDEAIPRAKDSTDQDVRVYEATAVGTRMTEAEQAEYKRLGTGQPRDKYMQRIAKEKAALHERAAERIGFVSFKVPGDGTFRLLNTVDRLKAFRSKVESSPGFKDRQAPLQSPRVNGYGMKKEPNTPFGVERGSGGPKAVIENMVDDGDPQAAVDYAAARGLDVAEVLKGDKVRLPKVAGLTPTAEAVGEFEPEVAPEPAAPAQPEAASAAPPAQQAESAGDMLGEFLASYDTPQEAGLARKALAATVTWKDGLKGPLSDHILGEYRKGARVALTASGMAFVNSDMRGWSKREIGEYGMQFANWLSSRDDAPAQQAEPSAPAPGKRADGRTIPTEGDEVFMESAGAFGMPAIVNGTVVRGKDGLRVKITAARGMLGETTSQKYAPLTPDWTLKGEESGASRRRREQAETLERESADRRAEYESDRTAAAERNGTLDASKAKLGDVIETPDGGLEVVAETDERGGLYTRPLDAGGESARGIGGDLRGYKFRPDVQLPTDGSQLIRRDGQDQALFADGWQDVKWNEDVQRYERVTPPTVKQRADSMRRKPEGEAAEASDTANKRRSIPKASVLTPSGSIKAAAADSKAPSSLWYYSGDIKGLQFTASVVVNGQPDPRAAEAKATLKKIKAAQEAGWRLGNYRAGSLGTVWVFEKDGDFLSRAGMDNADSEVTAWPDIPSYGAGYDNMVRGQREFAAALDRWLNTLPAEQQANQAVVSRKMDEVLGGWAGIERDKLGLHVRYYPRQDDGKRVVGWLHTISGSQTWEEARAKIAEMAGSASPAADAPAPAEQPASAFDQVKATMRAVYDGTASVEDYKAAYRRVRDAAAVKDELGKMTKEDLVRTFGIMAGTSEKKDTLVSTAYKAMLRGFALGKSYGPSGYLMTRGGLENYEKQQAEALDAIVENHTADDLAAYAAEVKAEREQKAAQRAARIEALQDPKTLEDFRALMDARMREGKTFDEARMTLTPEQRALMDEVAAAVTRGRRKVTNDDQRTQVRVAGQTVDGNIIATKHTKKGHDLYVVQLAERVSREDYETLNTGAKKIGGYYSSFRGGGAIPGFQFTTREQAQAFVTLAGGDATAAKEAAQERRDAYADDRSQTAAERLTEMAEAMDAAADESLSRERKANTERRARFAAAAEAGAREAKAMAKTMRNVAEALTSGKAKFLDRIRTKTQVELLQTYAANAKGDELRAKFPTYAEQEKRKGQPPTMETADYAVFPEFTAFRSDLASLGRQLQDVDGTKKIGDRLMKVADDVSDAFTAWVKEPGNYLRVAAFSGKDTGKRAVFPSKDTAERAIARSGYRGKAIPWSIKRGEWTVIFSPSEAVARGLWTGDGDKRITLTAEFGAEMVESIGRANRRGAKVSVPWQFERAYERRKQLSRMGIETPAEFRAALREFIGLREQAAEADRVKMLERAMVGKAKDGLDFFPTPESVADEMVAAADIQPDMAVLEPSAGMGHIADRIRAAGAEPDVVEMAGDRRELLQEKGYTLQGSDFLALKPREFFTYGDVFRAPDGTEGVMRGSGGMGSGQVGFDPLDANGEPDRRISRWVNRDDLVGVRHRGTGSGYDRILMNPPFSDGRDIEHVRHAYTLLKPGGRIVALMGESAFTNQNKRATEFREWLESVGGTEEKLPPGSFMDPSLPVNTGANARMVVIDKPESGQAPAVPLASRANPLREFGYVSPAALRTEVSKITATWDQDLADVEVVNRVEDLPKNMRDAVFNEGAEHQVRGMMDPTGQKVYIVAENISTIEEGLFVLFHETYGHVGLRAFLGSNYGLQMRVLRNANPALAREADAWFAAYGEQGIKIRMEKLGMTREAATRQVKDLAVEEALADRAGTLPELKGWKRLLAALQRGLRRLGLGSVADMLEGMTEAETVDLLVQARRTVQAGQRMRAGEMEPAMSRDAERAALRELSNADEMFALPRSDGKTVEQIAAEIYPSAKVSQLRPDPGQAARYSIEMPSGEVGYLYVRKPNQYGPTVYGFDLKDGDMTNIVEGRPGDNADAIPDDVEDVYIDVSKLKGTGAGQRIYAIAAAYAHNTDRVFIGDPAGLTDEAMRRRAENMLASALRYGTTAHLAPHPRQLAGAAKVGVPPLKWVYGDHIGNIRSLIAVNVQAMQNAGLDDAAISYDLAAGTFRDSSGSPITRAELDVLAKTTYLGDAGVAGSRTLARNALLRSLLREEGRGSTSGGQRDGLLALLAGINRGRPDAVGALFSRRTSQDTLRDVIPPAVQEWITDRTTSQRGFNRGWHRTVGTQLHKAKVNKEFGKAYYAVQDYMKDVSRMATLAADLAPDMLPQIETLGDLAKLAPTLASPAAYKQRKADIKAASDALFDGTLRYTRDESGEAVKVDPDSDELGGLVWTDAELKARGLSDRAVAMYRQSRQAIGQSLDNMLAADLYRQISVMDPEMVASDPGDYAGLMNGLRRAASSDTPRDTINQLQAAIRTRLGAIQTALDGQPNQHTPGLMQRRQDLRKVQEMIGEKVQRIEDLKDAGYTPLMRFGPYAVDVVNAQGRRVFFGMYESQAQANKAARNFRGDGLKVTQSVMPQKQFEALQGVSPETALLFAEMLGVEKNEAMQTWLKNAVAEQSALKRHIRRKGIEGFDDDGGRVLAAFITSNARAASRALHSQRISDAVENISQGDVQDEARALAEYVNNPKEEAQAIRSLLFVQYIGGSIASAIVNLTQTFAQTFPYLSQYGGGMKAGQRVGAAMKLALADKIPDAKLAAALARAERDGVVKPQEVFQLQAEASRSLGSNLYARSILAAWGSMFQLAEQFNRRVAFIAAYNTAVEQKIDDPFAFAENAVDETQSVFNKGNRPNWSRGAVGATLFTFKTFTIQYVEFLKRLATAGEPGSPERAAGQKAAALALMSIMVMAGSSGLPFADDLDDIIDTVAQGLGYNWTTKLQRDRFLDNLLGETFSGILQHGLSGVPGVPFDVSQRLGMANLLPGTGLLKQSETNKQNQVLEVFGVAGSAVRDATQGQFLPIAIRNIIKGLDTYETGMYRDGRGRNVTEADPLDAALKAIGLQPSVVARAQRDIGMQIEARNLYRAVKEEITDAWAQAQFQGDAEGVKKARDAMRKWNESNPDSRIIVLPQTIQQRVRQMRLSKADRTVANTPRPLRASTAEALQ